MGTFFNIRFQRQHVAMPLSRWSYGAMALCPLMLTCGCVNGPPASPSQAVCQPSLEGVEDPSAKHRPSSTGPVIFPIRLTDDGEFVKRCELTDALQEFALQEAN